MTKSMTREDKLRIIEENGGQKEHILSILLALQDASENGYVDQETITTVAQVLKMTETKVFEVASFYAMIETQSQAKHTLGICNSAPCHFTKADEVAGWLKDELGVAIGESTADGMFSYNFIPCVGACDVGPVIKVQDEVYGDLTAGKVKELIQGFKN